MLEIIYEDEELVAINKPHGLLVHRTNLAKDVDIFALQLLRDQIGVRVYPAHRLDRKTSGVLLFAKSKAVASAIQPLFSRQLIKKTYLAIVRGFVAQNERIDYSLKEVGKIKKAVTSCQALEFYEMPFPSHKFTTSRYSQVKLLPETGRFHQLRRHMAHIRHPIIGDRPHGCNKQNKLWKENFCLSHMLLHARELTLNWKDQQLTIIADKSEPFRRAENILKPYKCLPTPTADNPL